MRLNDGTWVGPDPEPAPPAGVQLGDACALVELGGNATAGGIAVMLDRMAEELRQRNRGRHPLGTTARAWEDGRVAGYREAADQAERVAHSHAPAGGAFLPTTPATRVEVRNPSGRCNCEATVCELAGGHVAGACTADAGRFRADMLGPLCDPCAGRMIASGGAEYVEEASS